MRAQLPWLPAIPARNCLAAFPIWVLGPSLTVFSNWSIASCPWAVHASR